MKQQISGLGVEAQREIIHNHVKNKPILAEYIETESGKKSNRPQLLAAFGNVQENQLYFNCCQTGQAVKKCGIYFQAAGE